jgi:hypothetical protein
MVPAPPGTQTGWIAASSGHHELRCWDNSRWPEHVSTAEEQSTDFLQRSPGDCPQNERW